MRLLHLSESLESEGLVLSWVVLIHKVWGRDDVNGGERRVEVTEGDPSLGCVHYRSVRHTLVFLICQHLRTINMHSLINSPPLQLLVSELPKYCCVELTLKLHPENHPIGFTNIRLIATPEPRNLMQTPGLESSWW